MRRFAGSVCLVVAAFIQVPALAQTQEPASAPAPIAPPSPDLPLEQRMEQALAALQPNLQVAGRTYAPRTLPELMVRNKVPAVSIAVIENGRVAWARAYGMADPTSGRAATTETMFQAASISKPVAATAALALVDQGVLNLDRPVNEQLTSWKVPPHQFGQDVTLRHLLTHTAGLTVHGFPGYRSDGPLPTLVQVLNGEAPANTAAVRVDQQPGSAWRYSGGGITVAQLLMADAAGEDFPALMDRLVLTPLGMANSTYSQPLPEARSGAVAVAHDSKGQAVAGRYHIYPEMAAAGLWTTPTDLAKWAVAVSSALKGEAGGPIRPETAVAMLTPGKGDWGLGVGVNGEGEGLRFSHSGANEGFRTILIAHPRQGQGVVIMTNSDEGAKLFGALIPAVGRIFGWPRSQPRILTPASVSEASRVEKVGRYANDTLSVHVGTTDDGLVIVPNAGAEFVAIPQGADVYVSPDNGFRVEFKRDPRSNGITALTVAGSTLQRME
jgi:CubicO group peptidase (beta-lactamase class C family)